MDAAEQVAILKLLDEGWNLSQVATKSGRSVAAISRLRAKYSPTTFLAERLIKAKALDLTQRVIDKADVDQSIEVLSRPNVGVLQPLKSGGGDFGGVHISVSANSVGAIVATTKGELGNGTEEHPRQHAILPAGGTLGPGEGTRSTEGEAGIESEVSAEPGLEASISEGDAGGGQRRRRHGVQRLVQRDEKVAPRVAILNKKRPKSSVHLRYDIVEPQA